MTYVDVDEETDSLDVTVDSSPLTTDRGKAAVHSSHVQASEAQTIQNNTSVLSQQPTPLLKGKQS